MELEKKMNKQKQKKFEKQLERIQQVMDGELDIDELTNKELQIMDEIMIQISLEQAIEERKHIKRKHMH